MKDTTFKGRMVSHTGEFMAALLLLQPMLDVLSYFMQNVGGTVFTTALRMALLITVSLYGFVISDRKRVYGVFYGLIAGFWLLHMLNCLRTGYMDPVGDAAEYLKLVQFPLWTLSFVTFFRRRDSLDYSVVGILAANFGIILLVVLLSFLTGHPVYTYDYPERGMQIGILGWFGVPNAQSAVLAMLVPPLLLWALRKEKFWLLCVTAFLGFGLLYATGTRLTYFSAVLTAAGILVLLLWNRKPLRFCLPLLLALVLLLGLKGFSPMEQRQMRSLDSNELYREKTEAVMGSDMGYAYRKGEEIPAEVKEKLERLYTEVYGVPGPYKLPLLGDMIEKFGLEAVMEAYGYTDAPEQLYNARLKKLKCLELNWQQKDFLTKMLGFEYAEATVNGNIYDPENDFPALLYYYGYLGAGLYLLFAAYFVFSALRALFRRGPGFVTLELGAAALMFCYALGAAQFSGQTLRKPNVCVYFSLAAAMLWQQSHPVVRNRPQVDRKSVVFLKKI